MDYQNSNRKLYGRGNEVVRTTVLQCCACLKPAKRVVRVDGKAHCKKCAKAARA